MPLSDLFKKQPKQEPPKRSSQEDVFGSPALQAERVEAATEVMEIFDRDFKTPQGEPHAGTALSAAGWLAGTSLYRSFGYKEDHEPGTMILGMPSEKANQESQKLLNTFTYYLFQSGMPMKLDQFILQVPDIHKPLQTILQVQEAHQDEYNTIMKRHGLDYLEGARAGMIVSSMAMSYLCTRRKAIDPRLGAGIVAISLVAGAKTVPPLLNSQRNSTPPLSPAPEQTTKNNPLLEALKSVAINSTSGSGTRLILGEGMTPMQEALSNGGKYILVHPAVISQLQQKNIDPFLVYEAGMRVEMGNKIHSIEFVGGNVDSLLQTWNGKPQNQIPIHIRQLLWLSQNANGLGYRKNGNSWQVK